MKHNLRKVLSVLMAVAMMAAMVVPAMAISAEGSVSAPNTVVNPIFNLVVPKTMTLVLDPLEIGEGTGQVKAPSLTVENFSNVITAVDISVQVIPAKGVTLVANDAEIPDTAGNTDKIANIHVLHDGKTDKKDLSADNSYDFSIVLTAGKMNEATKKIELDENGASKFDFSGAINSNAIWLAKDITLTTVYKATTLSNTAAEAFYTDFDKKTGALGTMTFEETTWPTEFRTYGFAATATEAEITFLDDAFTAATKMKFTSDAAATKVVDGVFSAPESGVIKMNVPAATTLKPGAITTYYAHVLDGGDNITATASFNVFVKN